jgi:hypothetical protein
METESSAVTYKNSVIKDKLRQYTVTMMGDSFLRGIRENMELSLSNKFGVYSVVKPGCELSTLLESAKSVSGTLTHNDVILICGGSNDFSSVKDDFSSGKDEATIDHIREFIQTNKHTNIVVANVPIRYDLSYY